MAERLMQWHCNPFLLNAFGFDFSSRKFFVRNSVGIHAFAPGLDLGPKVQVPQKSEKVCLHGGGHLDYNVHMAVSIRIWKR